MTEVLDIVVVGECFIVFFPRGNILWWMGVWILLIYCWHFVFCQGVGDVIYSVIVVAYWRYSFSCFLPRIRIGSMRPLRDLQRLGVLEAPLAFFVHWFVAFFVALALNIPPRKKRGMALEWSGGDVHDQSTHADDPSRWCAWSYAQMCRNGIILFVCP